MKKNIFYLFPLLAGGLLIFFLAYMYFFPKENIKIAVIGPLDGEHKSGIAIMQGVQLYIDEINSQGGINGKKIELVVKDDKNERKLAIAKATEVAESDEILLVLGHNFSSTSIEAGRVYQKHGVAAITGSATAVPVTKDNDWFFRVIPNTAFQGSFTANFINKSLNQNSASIIYDKGIFGTSMAENFEKASQNLGVKIIKKWGFDKSKENLNAQFIKIITELRAVESPGIIFLSMLKKDSVKILTLLRSAGTKHLVILGDELTEDSFKSLAENPQEQAIPGYFSNNVFGVTPFLISIGNKKAQGFRQKFIKKYNREPLWYSASFYDATMVAVEAIKRAEVFGNGRIRTDRKAVRKAIAEMLNYEQSLEGVTGRIYFDQNGDANSPLAVGQYSNKKLIPDYDQYQLISSTEPQNDVVEKSLNGDLIIIDDKLMSKTQVVYTGIDINEISNVNFENSTFTADFYLWYRFSGNFDEKNIIFTNSVGSVDLGEPILTEDEKALKINEDGVNLRTYRIKADFSMDIDYHDYPFQKINLPIMLRHRQLKRDKLIFVVDRFGLQTKKEKEGVGIKGFQTDTGLMIENQSFFQSVSSNISTLGNPKYFKSPQKNSYSKFNAVVQLKHKNVIFIIKVLLPIIVMVLILYAQCFVSAKHLWIRLLFSLSIFTGNVLYHVRYLNHLAVNYITAIEYLIFLLYILVLFGVFESVLSWILLEKENNKVVKILANIGRISYPVILIFAILWFVINLYQ